MNAHKPALVLLAVCSLAVSGCGGKLEDPQRFADLVRNRDAGGNDGGGNDKTDAAVKPAADAGPNMAATPPACVTTLFKNTCGMAGCHDAKSTTLDLVSTGVTSRLLDKESKSALCADKPYISTNGVASLLIGKVTMATPPCGSRMPIGRVLNATETKCLTDWVTSLGGEAGGT